MNRIVSLFILSSLYGFILGGCSVRRIKEVEYVNVKDTVIIPEPVKLDTLVKWNDRFITVYDSTKQLTVTIERLKNNYIKIKADCEPKTIIVPVTKTVVKSKQVIVQSLFWKRTAMLLLLVIGVFVIYTKLLTKGV